MRRGWRASVVVVGGWLASIAIGACEETADPRPQLLIVVDTDAVVGSVAANDPDIALVAALDTLRVDAIPSDGSNTAYDLRTFVAPDSADWPLSFGVAADEASFDGPVRLRIRLFPGKLGRAGELAGEATIDPPPTVTIDRLIEVSPPAEGIKTVRVVLRQDCLGVPSFFTDPPETCVDAQRRTVAPAEGVDEVAEGVPPLPSEVGTWSAARAVPCSEPAPAGADALCIPGGYDVLGNRAFVDVSEAYFAAAPVRPVLLSPYWMDRTEVTVGRLRQVLDSGLLPADFIMPLTPADADATRDDFVFCTWDNADVTDAFPLNCISQRSALQVCEALGGTLPSEAQWEHAAAGRGQARVYPWGDDVPSCCATSVSRAGPPEVPTECEGSGLEPVGSHQDLAACAGLGDVSRDGVLDLAGSVTEALRDMPQGFDAPCWTPPRGIGIPVDPVCVTDALVRSARGAYWNGGRLTTAIPFRHSATVGPTNGFRCVYPGGSLP